MRLLLVRHAAHDLDGRAFAGRLPGLSINARGRTQALQLAARLAPERVDALYCSPQPRTRQTAAPIGARLGLSAAVAPEFDEIDFGDWTGRAFDELRREQPGPWQAWVQRRGSACAPGGEAFAAVQRRALAGVQRLQRTHATGCVLVVSHGDVIKSVLAHFLGMSLDRLESFAIDCASLSELALGEDWAQVRRVNG